MILRLSTTQASAIVTSLLLIACGNDRPSNYAECLVELGRSRPAAEARQLCRSAFPEPQKEVPFYVGRFYYATTGKQCHSISIEPGGYLSSYESGYCGSGSRVECKAVKCWFTCANHNGSDSAVVTLVTKHTDGLNLHSAVDPSVGAGLLFGQRAQCELVQQQRPSEEELLEFIRSRSDSLKNRG
jgi:hypothetical protein